MHTAIEYFIIKITYRCKLFFFTKHLCRCKSIYEHFEMLTNKIQTLTFLNVELTILQKKINDMQQL